MKKKLAMISANIPVGGIAMAQKNENAQWSNVWSKEESHNEVDNDVKESSTQLVDNSFKQFDIQPNPATNVVQVIARGHHTVMIYNAEGHLMNHYIFAHRVEIDTSNYPRGIYTVRLDRVSKKLWLY